MNIDTMLFNPLLHINTFWHLYYVFENIFENVMENGACSIYVDIFKIIQNFT